MRYRKLTADGDYSFGQGNANFWINVPEAPAQAIQTRLLLILKEWFLDLTEGTDYAGQILGTNTQATRDLEIKNRVLETEGVQQILQYASSVKDRKFTPQVQAMTIYGPTGTITVPTP